MRSGSDARHAPCVRLDAERSALTIRTRAEGLLARVAHDLELRAGTLAGDFEGDSGRVRVPIAGLRVVGAVKRGALHEGALSASDKAEIERRIREVVLAGSDEVHVDVTLTGTRASLRVHAPRGTQQLECEVQREDAGSADRGGVRVRGRCALSLAALGVAPIKLPLGAGRVADAVEVRFEAQLVP